MKKTFSMFLCLGIFALSVNNIFAQDNSDARWSHDPSTRVRVLGNYTDLPQKHVNVNLNTNIRRVNTTGGDFLVPPNVRPFPTTQATESEVASVTQVGNQNVMYAAWNSYGPAFYGTGFCFTNNGGVSWTGNSQMIVSGNNGDPGPWVWSTGSTWPGRLGISVIGNAGTAAFYSTDNGSTWGGYTSLGGSSADKNLSAVDDVPGSPFLGRAYTVWTDFGGSYANRIVGAYTTNGGVSWAGYGPVSPVPPSGHHMQGCDVQVGPGGVVYVVWATCLTNGQNSTEDYLGFAKSTDGGVTWPVSNYNVVDVNGIRTLNLYNGIRANGFPRLAIDKSGGPRNGWIYAVLSEKLVAPARDNADMCMCRSTDGGTTWTHTLINGDPSGNYNFMGAVAVDNAGNVGVSYYDTRGLTVPTTQFYLSWSANGGNSWVDVLVSDHTFVPAPIPGLAGGYQGDYTGITASNGKFYPFWADNSSGIYQVWTVGISPIQLAHDIQCGPFLSLPSLFLINTSYPIKTKVTNLGTSNETGIPVKFFINGTLTNTTNINLTAGQSDSVTNNWTPNVAGVYNLKYVASLSTDTTHSNDTIQTNVTVYASLPPLCEGFTSGTFPPVNWSFGPSGGSYWSRQSVSGFNLGSGSAYYDMWNAPSGTTQDLITLTFPASSSGDSLKFDIAFCPYFSNNDQLQISSSTNGGTSYTILVTMGPSQMQTVSSCSHPFTPVNSSDWGRRYFPLPTGTNKIKFTGISAFGDGVFIDSTCVGQINVGISNNNNEIPKVYSLAQNYPNPFNPVSKIQYALPKAGLVKLVVYDLLGEEVATLVNEYKPVGYHTAEFNGSNLASGVYFYKIVAGDFTAVKKMMLVK